MKTLKNQIPKLFTGTSLGMVAATIGVLILIFTAGPAVYGMDAQVRMNTGISHTIEKVLKENCQCEKVDQFFLMQGFQVKKQESFGRRADYKIYYPKNACDLNQEMIRLNEILNKNITDYETLDLVTFEFIVHEKHSIFSVQNGNINF